MTAKEKVGSNVRATREKKGMTQLELGRAIGLRGTDQSAATAIYRVEHGEWSVARLKKIAGALGVQLSSLLRGADPVEMI